MNTKFLLPVRVAILAVAIAIVCAGCFLVPPKHSTYRPIHTYATAGDVAAVTQDLTTNFSDLNLPDDAGRTPLHLAVAHCRIDVVKLLLQKGAKINIKAEGGSTPLHLAAQSGCVEGVTLLLASGAKINARDAQGRTPLDRAAQWHRDAAAEIIRQHGGMQ